MSYELHFSDPGPGPAAPPGLELGVRCLLCDQASITQKQLKEIWGVDLVRAGSSWAAISGMATNDFKLSPSLDAEDPKRTVRQWSFFARLFFGTWMARAEFQ